MPYRRELRLRRLATQLYGMLPEAPADAREVLGYVDELITEFILPKACRVGGSDACKGDPAPLPKNVTVIRGRDSAA
jgi:hypothetical protein